MMRLAPGGWMRHSTAPEAWTGKEEALVLQALEDVEIRIIGSLIEKSVVTPDMYPLTLNALTNACNQKSARDPGMALQKGEVQHTIRVLEAKHLVRIEENFKSRTEKYVQRFCNTRYSDFQFDPAELAVVTLLLLRGPQTPGELRAHSGRLHTFADNDEVVATVTRLIEREGAPSLVELPRTPGRKDAEYMHLFGGPIDLEAYASTAKSAAPAGSVERSTVAELAERVAQLESEVAELKKMLQ
jgi:uncharacterized protein YceH (UPF0502 family)